MNLESSLTQLLKLSASVTSGQLRLDSGFTGKSHTIDSDSLKQEIGTRVRVKFEAVRIDSMRF